MLIGLLADTHDCLPMVDKAIRELNAEKVEIVLHAGDYVSPFVIPKFRHLRAQLVGVFGNNDGDHEMLKKRFGENERLEIRGDFADLTLGKMRIGLLHGSDPRLLKVLIESGRFGVLVYGHTHNAEIHRVDKTLVVNPGEVCGYLSGKATIALLDTAECNGEIIEL